MDTMDTPVNLPPATDPVGLISALLTDLQQLVAVLPGCEMPASAQAARNFLRGKARPESGHHEALEPALLERARAMVGNWRVYVSDGEYHVFTSLPEALIAEIDRLTGELMGYRRSFQLRWAADKRATERWRKEAPDRELTWPDHADLVVWLLGQLREMEAERDKAVALSSVMAGQLEPRVPARLPPALVVQYRNYRGEVAVRNIVPIGRPFHGVTDHHPKAGWILPVYDVDRSVEREFAMDDMVPLAAMDGCRETVASITSWARDTFGEPTGVQRPLLRLVNEVVEACIAAGLTHDVVQARVSKEWVRQLQKGATADPEALPSELAGIFVLLCRVADAASTPLRAAVDDEMERNRERPAFSRGDAGAAIVLPSPDEVQAAQLPNGGWAPEQLAAWGVSNPPAGGWRKRLAEAWRIQQQLDGAPQAALEPVQQAVADYHFALDTRQHGDIAANCAVRAIQRALGMPWVQGEEKARREAAAGEGVDHA